jgi:hypothetical protein
MYQLINVGWIALNRHDFSRARAALEEYLAEESWKNPAGIANAEVNLAAVAICQERHDEAGRRFRQALVYARAPRARPTITSALFGVAAVAALVRQPESMRGRTLRRNPRSWSILGPIATRRGLP